MASRLQRFVNRTVKQHLEKPTSAYETDEDFRVGRFGENVEKKLQVTCQVTNWVLELSSVLEKLNVFNFSVDEKRLL